MDRHRVEVVQLLAAVPEGRDEVGGLENRKVLGYGLPRHGEAVAEFAQGLTVFGVKPVEQGSSRCIGQRLEHVIHGVSAADLKSPHNRQPNGCMSRGCFGERDGCASVSTSQHRLAVSAWVEKT